MEIKNPYSMSLIEANKTKLYNQSKLWAFNTAKYRALMSNDPAIIKYFYRNEFGKFITDGASLVDIQRSFYYGGSEDESENAEEYFGIIPMICESIAKMVCGSGYEFDETVKRKIKKRLTAILDDNAFDTEILKASIIETLGLGSPAWHVYFDAEISDHPIIELVQPERLEFKRKSNRIIEYTVKQQVVIDGDAKDLELHTVYTKRRKSVKKGKATRYKDDGIVQTFKVYDGTHYIDKRADCVKEVFNAYGIQQDEVVLPLIDFPIVYLPNNLNRTNGIGSANARPYGVVFGLESVSSAIDEILSNCVDTVRKSFPYLLIDEQMIPSDIKGNKNKSSFSTRRHSFMLPKNANDADKLLQQIQAKLNTSEFVEALKFQINIALNKVGINAATLGLQLSGHVESESTQNAKERNSIRTRNTVAADYEKYLEKLFAVVLQYEDFVNGSIIATDRATGESGYIVEEYSGIKAHFNRYIVDTPEEVVNVLARKVQSNLMSIFAAVREQHPDWDEQTLYKETNLIYAEQGKQFQVVDPTKPPEQNGAVTDMDASGAGDGENAAENDENDGDGKPPDKGQNAAQSDLQAAREAEDG